MRLRKIVLISVVAACGGTAGPRDTVTALRAACADGEYWSGTACAKAGDAPAKLATSKEALDALKVDDAKVALDAAESAGPLDREHNVALWEQRGIAAAYVDDEQTATAAFDMLLALDPGHFLSYTLSPKATFVFEKVRANKARTAPELDVSWTRGGKVGEPLAVGVEVLSDPKQFLRHATLFVRTRGETAWHAADVTLVKGEQRVVLPAIDAKKSLSLEVYLRAYDDRNNEVLTWADPARPREIALRYDPPRPWYFRWWGIAAIGSAVAAIASVTAYELTLAPPDKIGGTVTVK
jgi:hypothetical protein